MLNSRALAAVGDATFGGSFIRPRYEDYCFAGVPGTIERLLTGAGGPALPDDTLPEPGQRYETVVLLFLDAFGWRFCAPRLESSPFLRRFLRDGVVSPLTTMFPSTTSAHVTTIHTGLPPAQSGIYEWYYYEPTLDMIASPLLFAPYGDRRRETLLDYGGDPQQIFPHETLYQRLARAGVGATVLQSRDYAFSTYTRQICRGASLGAFRTVPEALTLLGQARAAQRGPHYYLLYLDNLDAICHSYGPESPHLAAEIDVTLDAVERLLIPALAGAGGPTLLLLVADHGQIAIDPGTTRYVNLLVPDLAEACRQSRGGRTLAPAGSRRDLFLHIREDRLDAMRAALRDALAGQAEVHATEDLIGRGLFGGPATPFFRERVGNLAVLPYAGETAWWHEPGAPPHSHCGSHGGLTAEEAITQLCALAL